ncbi:MAG: hypothetical protein APR54_03490 [Candidatus Cloacimonas sp. SDB]|nr:MAG: hypothetical protein APR54_03490 [Candidatus Cloacimonas sp. SDB]
MKKIFFSLIIIALFSLLVGSDEVLTQTLPNGMTIAVKESSNNSSVGFYCFVKTGSVNEGRFLGAGISHYLEHVVSGGSTTKRTEAEYEALGSEIGSIVNAYTTNELTAYHIVVDKLYKDQALEILSEQIQFCAFNAEEVAREQQVILKEIVMRSSPPRSQVYQRVNEISSPHSNYRYPVIGYTDLFKTITREELQEYYQQHYTPNNMIFVAVGDFDSQEVMDQITATFKDFSRKQIQPVYLPTQNIRNGDYELIEEFAVDLPNGFLTYIVPAAYYGDYVALDAALNILFAKRRSPIRFKLSEELKLVNYVYGYASISATAPEGSINIGFEAKDPADLRDIAKIIDSEIENYSREGFTAADIEDIVTRRKASRLLSTPGVQSECNRIGWNLIRYGVPDAYDALQKKYEELTVADLQAVLKRHLLPKNRTVFYSVPEGDRELLEKSTAVDIVKTDPQRHLLNDSITLIHRFNNEKPIIKGVIHLPLSSNYESKENVGMISFMTELMFRGSQNYDPLDITEWLEDHAVRFSVTTNSYGTEIEFKCLTDDYDKLKEIILDAMNNPVFPESEIELYKEAEEAAFKRSRSDADDIHQDYLKSVLYGDTRDGLSSQAKLDIMMKANREDLISTYEDYFKFNRAIITFFGDISDEEAESEAQDLFSKLPRGDIAVEAEFYQIPELNDIFINTYELEQVNISVNCVAPAFNDADFNVLIVIESLLSGSRGRLHKAVRGTNDLAYFAFPRYGYNQESGYFRLTSQTSIDKKDELIAVMNNVLDELCAGNLTQSEIDLALEERQKILISYMDDNNLPEYMTHYEAQGLGYDYIFRYNERYKDITPEDIQRVASKYFSQKAVVVSLPSGNVNLMVD